LKEYQQRKSSGVPEGAKTKKKKTGSSPETTTSGGCHSPGDSQYQGLAVALESSSVTINQLNENIESLKEQKKQVEHQLEEAKKANNEIHKAQTEQLEVSGGQSTSSHLEKADLKTTLYHTKRAARHFEGSGWPPAILLTAYSRIGAGSLCCVYTAAGRGQVLSCSEAVLQRRLQQTIKERALLNAHVTQMTESLKQVQLQKDEYAEHIKGERARWQERMRKMSVEARTLKEEKKSDIHRIQELERSLSEFKNQMAEPPSLAPSSDLCEQREQECTALGAASKELQEKLDEEHLEAASQQNQQLETQLSLMALPGE
ncbi:GOLGA6B isoform 1, partial [Pongo abelii]